MSSAFRNQLSTPLVLSGVMCLALAGCQRAPDIKAATPPGGASSALATSGARLDIRPDGDTESKIDMSKIQNEDLKKVFGYIDAHADEHTQNLQKWIQQPSISNSGEGIPESAEMVKGLFEQLGCPQSRVYDVGTTEWGSQGNPVVYAKCDEGAEKTLVIYWMYDTMPVTQPDAWIARRDQLQGTADGPVERADVDQGDHWQAARQSDHRRRG